MISNARPETFEVAKTAQIAQEIGRINARLAAEGRKYLLAGPGRWGTADRWLGIPVAWNDICGVAAIVETQSSQLRVEPSQGSHFFHNITTLGINYVMVSGKPGERFDWDWLVAQDLVVRDEHVIHVRLPRPMVIKVDGRSSCCAMLMDDGSEAGECAPNTAPRLVTDCCAPDAPCGA